MKLLVAKMLNFSFGNFNKVFKTTLEDKRTLYGNYPGFSEVVVLRFVL